MSTSTSAEIEAAKHMRELLAGTRTAVEMVKIRWCRRRSPC